MRSKKIIFIEALILIGLLLLALHLTGKREQQQEGNEMPHSQAVTEAENTTLDAEQNKTTEEETGPHEISNPAGTLVETDTTWPKDSQQEGMQWNESDSGDTSGVSDGETNGAVNSTEEINTPSNEETRVTTELGTLPEGI